MNDKERILNALDNKPVDRVPVGFWFHFLTQDPGFVEFNAALTDPGLAAKNIEGHRAYIEGLNPDFVKIMSDGYFFMPIEGAKEFECPDDLKKIKALDRDHPWIEAQVKLCGSVTRMRKDTAYFYNIFSPTRSLWWNLGDAAFFEFIARDPQAVSDALAEINKTLLILAERVIRESGVDGIYFSASNPNYRVVSDGMYRKYISPVEISYLREVGKLSEYNILHICSNSGKKNNLELFADYPVKAFSWASHSENTTLAQGKKLFGGKAVLGGFEHIPGSIIHAGSKEEIKAYAKTLIEQTGRVGVIIGADCTVPSDTPLEHIEWVRQVVACS